MMRGLLIPVAIATAAAGAEPAVDAGIRQAMEVSAAGWRSIFSRPARSMRRTLFARWTLTGKTVETGMTTLLFEKRGGAWKIAADDSS